MTQKLYLVVKSKHCLSLASLSCVYNVMSYYSEYSINKSFGPDHVESLHVDKDAGKEPLEHLAEDVGHQSDKPQLQVLRHFLQNPTSLLSHLFHR